MRTQIALSNTNLASPMAIMKRRKRDLTFNMLRKNLRRGKRNKEDFKCRFTIKLETFSLKTFLTFRYNSPKTYRNTFKSLTSCSVACIPNLIVFTLSYYFKRATSRSFNLVLALFVIDHSSSNPKEGI